MQATDHGDHLVRLERFRIANAWLVREDDGLTLVDTTPAGAADALIEAARVHGGGGPIRRIVITHAHNDHYGSLDALHSRLPDAEVLLPARDARFLAGDRSFDPGEKRGPMNPLFVTKIKTRPTRTLVEGDRVGSLEVVAAPGHTIGQIALLDTRDRTLLCGDAYLALGGLFVTSKPVKRFPVPALLGTWDRATANATAHKLVALEPSRLGTGHGPLVEPAVPAMRQAIAEAPGA
jgi:glyoxylase-like metal-dependent hydrolase (beta-lactamase superfamily II)